jgi:hypothetical protein
MADEKAINGMGEVYITDPITLATAAPRLGHATNEYELQDLKEAAPELQKPRSKLQLFAVLLGLNASPGAPSQDIHTDT